VIFCDFLQFWFCFVKKEKKMAEKTKTKKKLLCISHFVFATNIALIEFFLMQILLDFFLTKRV